jgi:hypothetical protein
VMSTHGSYSATLAVNPTQQSDVIRVVVSKHSITLLVSFS